MSKFNGLRGVAVALSLVIVFDLHHLVAGRERPAEPFDLALAVDTGLPGQEIEGILGGLVSSTPLTLLALPGPTARLLRPVDLVNAADV